MASLEPRLRKLEAAAIPADVMRVDVVFVQVGQTDEEALRLKYGDEGAPEGVKLIVVQFVAPKNRRPQSA